jgi:hypothetical protein
MGSLDEEALLRGQVEVWQLMFGFAESMALKCAIELGIADIINSLGGPVTLNQIASGSLQFPLVFSIHTQNNFIVVHLILFIYFFFFVGGVQELTHLVLTFPTLLES